MPQYDLKASVIVDVQMEIQAETPEEAQTIMEEMITMSAGLNSTDISHGVLDETVTSIEVFHNEESF